jgi:hypothetical protein
VKLPHTRSPEEGNRPGFQNVVYFRKPDDGLSPKSSIPESYLCLSFPCNDHMPHNNGDGGEKYEGVKIYGSISDTLASLAWDCHPV